MMWNMVLGILVHRERLGVSLFIESYLAILYGWTDTLAQPLTQIFVPAVAGGL